jgi:hypothetical protein
MFISREYLRCAHIALVVSMAVLIPGALILGSDASDGAFHVLAAITFGVGMATLLFLTGRVDRQRRDRRSDGPVRR